MSRTIILMYHMVSDPVAPKDKRYACSQTLFRRHIRFLRDRNFTIISLDDFLIFKKKSKPIPPNTVIITFDDGFADNYEQALPVLREANAPATIFLATGVIGSTNKWMKGQGFSERRMLSWGQIDEMSKANGITFGSHTVSHPRLTEVGTDQVDEELICSKKTIEDKLGMRVDHFAYPFGLESSSVRESARRAGYQSACSTRSGFNGLDADPFLLRRIEVCGTDSLRRFKQKITFGTNDSSLSYPLRYYTGRARERLKR